MDVESRRYEPQNTETRSVSDGETASNQDVFSMIITLLAVKLGGDRAFDFTFHSFVLLFDVLASLNVVFLMSYLAGHLSRLDSRGYWDIMGHWTFYCLSFYKFKWATYQNARSVWLFAVVTGMLLFSWHAILHRSSFEACLSDFCLVLKLSTQEISSLHVVHVFLHLLDQYNICHLPKCCQNWTDDTSKTNAARTFVTPRNTERDPQDSDDTDIEADDLFRYSAASGLIPTTIKSNDRSRSRAPR